MGGLYFPMMGTLKGLVVPEENRSAIYNLYRVPLNIIVVMALVAKLDIPTAFTITTCMLVVAIVCQTQLIGLRGGAQYRPVTASSSTNVEVEFGLDDDENLGSLAGEAVVMGNKS